MRHETYTHCHQLPPIAGAGMNNAIRRVLNAVTDDGRNPDDALLLLVVLVICAAAAGWLDLG